MIGYLDEIKYLLSERVDINCTHNGGFQITPAMNCRNEVVQLLITEGADPNITDKDGNSPLHYAALYGNINMAKVLIEGGSDPKIADKWGATPLHNAAMHGCQDMVELLLNAGSDPNIANESG